MDSNHDNQLQRLVSYQLDDPGVVELKLLTSCRNFGTRVNWVKYGNFRTEIRHFFKFRLDKIRSKMSVASDHFLTAMPNPLLDNLDRRSGHDQCAHSVVPETVHAATFQSEFAEQWMKVLVENGRVDERCFPF
jgi:hypothetical protein